MKTAAKVFIIISMVLTFWLIFPIIIGIIALKKLDNPTTKDNMILWGILTLVLVSLLGGIFYLLYNDELFNKGSVTEAQFTTHTEDSKSNKLKELKKLLDDGVITEEEFNRKKQDILDQF